MLELVEDSSDDDGDGPGRKEDEWGPDDDALV